MIGCLVFGIVTLIIIGIALPNDDDDDNNSGTLYSCEDYDSIEYDQDKIDYAQSWADDNGYNVNVTEAYNAYEENCEEEEEENEESDDAVSSTNGKFGGVTRKRFKQLYGVLIPELPINRHPEHLTFEGELPDSLDWQLNGFVNPVVYDQGDCGACWAFSTLEATESRCQIQNESPVNYVPLSEQEEVDCSEESDCSGGTISSGYEYNLDNDGVCTQEEYGVYTQLEGKCRSSDCEERYGQIKKYVDLESDEQQMMIAIQSGPLVVAVHAT
eukprot:UN23425